MKKKLLIADDDSSITTALKLLLENDDVEVDIAGDRAQGIAAISAHTYDLYLFDLRFSGVGSQEGIELAELVRENNPNVPVFLMTAWGSDAVEEAARRLRLRFLEKPIEPETLIELLNDAGIPAGPLY